MYSSLLAFSRLAFLFSEANAQTQLAKWGGAGLLGTGRKQQAQVPKRKRLLLFLDSTMWAVFTKHPRLLPRLDKFLI